MLEYYFSNDLAESAQELAGNWKSFELFTWLDPPEDSDNWCIVYTVSGDSDALTESNNAVIKDLLGNFKDAREERHNHYLFNGMEGWAVRVYDAQGNITPAFRTLFHIAKRLANGAVLDKVDFSERTYQQSLENIREMASSMVKENAPDDWPQQVFDWFANFEDAEADEDGFWLTETEMLECLSVLGFLDPDYES